MILEDTVSHHTFFAVNAYVDSHDKPSQPSVVFACLNGVCSLSAIKMDNGTLKFAPPRIAARDRGVASVVSIPLTSRTEADDPFTWLDGVGRREAFPVHAIGEEATFFFGLLAALGRARPISRKGIPLDLPSNPDVEI